MFVHRSASEPSFLDRLWAEFVKVCQSICKHQEVTEERNNTYTPALQTQEGLDSQEPAVAATAAVEGIQPVPDQVNPKLLLSIYEWLESIDDSLFMLQYYDQIISSFDSLKQIHDIYFRDGRLDTGFFTAAGIAKLGHKRIIEKWFRENG